MKLAGVSLATLLTLISSAGRADDAAKSYVPPAAYPVHIQLRSDAPELKLSIERDDGATLCIEPCGVDLQIKEYQRFNIEPTEGNRGLRLVFDEIPRFALPPERPSVSLRVEQGNPRARLASAYLLGGGGAIGLIGGFLAAGGALGLAEADCATSPCSTSRRVRNSGLGLLGGGALLALIGGLLWVENPSPKLIFE